MLVRPMVRLATRLAHLQAEQFGGTPFEVGANESLCKVDGQCSATPDLRRQALAKDAILPRCPSGAGCNESGRSLALTRRPPHPSANDRTEAVTTALRRGFIRRD
jgi:hypothetical protein